MNCAAHIWCWPTSEVTMASPPERRSISSIRCCGLISASERDAVVADARPSSRGSGPTRRARAAACLRLAFGREFLRATLFSFCEHALHVAHDGHIGGAILADFGGIDIHMDDFGVRREGGQAAGDAVVEAHAEGDQQVAVGHAHVGGVAAVHAGHADEIRMAGGQAAEPHQGADGGRVDAVRPVRAIRRRRRPR